MHTEFRGAKSLRSATWKIEKELQWWYSAVSCGAEVRESGGD